MDELTRQIEAARETLQPRWDDVRSAELLAGVSALRRRRAATRVVGATLAVAAAAVFAWAGPLRGPEASVGSVLVSTGEQALSGDRVLSGHTLHLTDGSSARLEGEHSELRIVHNTPANVRLELASGRAHFDVVPNTMRSFIVSVGSYRVVVIGTVFDVVRSADQVTVEVSHGKVRVYGPRGAVDVAAGEAHSFVLDAAAEPAAADQAEGEADEVDEQALEPAEPARATKRGRGRGRRAGDSWRSLHQSGDYDGAFALLQGGANVPDEASALMDAADAARLSGHPRGAVTYLERVVRDHRQSPVAPLAAFTLGRVYLDRLGQPHLAAAAFDRARALAPRGSLAQDALAREVEALSKAGNAQAAYRKAQIYLEAYPRGSRLRAVRMFGGLE